MFKFLFSFILLICFVRLQAQQESHYLQKKISISFKESHLSDCFKMMETSIGIHFYFNADEVKEADKIMTASFQDQPLEAILKKLLAGTGLQFQETHIGILLKKQAPEAGGYRSAPVQAKSGGLRGRVVDFETSQPLPGATVTIEESGRSVLSDEKGFYRFTNLANGVYTLIVSYTGYQKNYLPGLRADSSRQQVLDIKMQPGTSLNEVVITAGRARKVRSVTHTTDKALLQEIRNATGSVSGISNEAIIRTPDRNAAEVVKRISGVSVVDQRFIVVRGMNERYNMTYLNGNIAPSTELYNKAFSYDLLPSSIIDKILVYKSPVADLSAEYSGAAVKIFTKEPQAVRHFDIGVQLAHRPGSTMTDIMSYTGGKYDFLGFDDGTRKLPPIAPGYLGTPSSATGMSQSQLVSAFSSVLAYGYAHSLPDMQLYANYYNGWRLGKHTWLYDLSSATFTHETQNQSIYHQTGNTWSTGATGYNVGSANAIRNTQQSIQDGKINILENLTLKFNRNHVLELKNFFVNDGQVLTQDNITRPNVNPHYDTIAGTTPDINRSAVLSFQQRMLYSGNLGGHDSWKAGRSQLRWNLGYTYIRQNVPDQRISNFVTSWAALNGQTPEPAGLAWEAAGSNYSADATYLGMISRLFVRTLQNTYNASLDWSLQVLPTLSLKAGTYQMFKTRDVNRRFFRVNRGGLAPGETFSSTQAPGWYDDYGWSNLNITNFRYQQLSTIWNPVNFPQDGSGLWLYDITSPVDRYVASEQNNAGYVMGDWALLPELTLNAGLRFEFDRMKLAGATLDNPFAGGGTIAGVNVNRPVTSWLPSFNLTYRPGSEWAIRGGYGRTVDRQDFRELTPYNDFDFQNQQVIVGNPGLLSATIDNADARLEWYPKSIQQNEVFEIGGFYKHLYHPIERVYSQVNEGLGGTDFTSISFQNAHYAKVYGIEAEVRKNLSFLGGGVWRNLSLVANGSVIHSMTMEYTYESGPGIPETFPSVKGRPLQGQAPYVINGGIYYENPAWGTKLGLIYNVTGPIIYAKSSADPKFDSTTASILYPDILELPRQLLDASLTQHIVKSLQVKFSVQNLLNKPIRQVQDWNYNEKYDPEKPHINPTGLTYYTGDNIFNSYNPGRYFILSFTYAF